MVSMLMTIYIAMGIGMLLMIGSIKPGNDETFVSVFKENTGIDSTVKAGICVFIMTVFLWPWIIYTMLCDDDDHE